MTLKSTKHNSARLTHKTVDADHSKSPEGLLGVLGHMLSGKSLDLLLAAAAATGKLKSFARKFIK